MHVFAGPVTSGSEAREFDRQVLPREADRTFIHASDYRTSSLGVVPVSGLNSSTSIWLLDVAAMPERLGLVLSLEDEPPQADDRVIATCLVRVQKERQAPPERIRVQLTNGDRTENFSCC